MPEAPLNPWFSIWLRPRATMRQILDTDPHRMVVVLAMAGGFLEALNRASVRSLGEDMSVSAILVMCAIVGPVTGIIGLVFYGWLLRVVGGWLGGVADRDAMRAAIAWGSVVFLWAGLLWIPQYALVGEEMFLEETPRWESSLSTANAMLALAVLGLGILVWGVFTYLKCIGEAHRFSAWRALGTLLLAGLVTLAVAAVVVLLLVALGLFELP